MKKTSLLIVLNVTGCLLTIISKASMLANVTNTYNSKVANCGLNYLIKSIFIDLQLHLVRQMNQKTLDISEKLPVGSVLSLT